MVFLYNASKVQATKLWFSTGLWSNSLKPERSPKLSRTLIALLKGFLLLLIRVVLSVYNARPCIIRTLIFYYVLGKKVEHKEK